MRLRLASTGAAILVASALVNWPGFGYDILRLPLVAVGAAMLLMAGAAGAMQGRAEKRPAPLWTLAALAFLVAHLLSLATALNLWAAAMAMIPVLAGLTIFWAIARGWVSSKAVEAGPELAAVVAILTSGLGIAQRAFRHPLFFGYQDWPVSTIGNTNYAGAFAAMMACLCLGGALGEGPLRRRILCVAGAAMAAAHAGVSDSRGALVGLGAGVIVAAIAMARQRRWKEAAICFVLVAVPAGFRMDRVRLLFDAGEHSARVRLGLWKGTAELAGAYPVAGCGVGNFQFQFPPFREAREFELSNEGKPNDLVEARDPHSAPLMILAETGPLGLAAFLTLLALAGIVAWRHARETIPIASAAGLAAFAFAGLFCSLHGFSPFDIMSGAMLGALAACESRDRDPLRREGNLRAAGAALAVVLAVVGVLGASAQRRFYESIRRPMSVRERIAWLESALAAAPDHWPARESLGQARLRAGDLPGAVREYRRLLEIHPHSLSALNDLAIAVNESGERELAEGLLRRAESIQPNYWKTQYALGSLDPTFPSSARARLLRAVELNPAHGKSYYYLGIMAAREGKTAEAVDWLRKARANKINVGEQLKLAGYQREPLFAEFFRP